MVLFWDFDDKQIMVTGDVGVGGFEDAFAYCAAEGLPAYQPTLADVTLGSRRSISPALLNRLLGSIMDVEHDVRDGWLLPRHWPAMTIVREGLFRMPIGGPTGASKFMGSWLIIANPMLFVTA